MIGSSTKETILNAAVALLSDHGFHRLTGPQVAKKAKVRQSHVTYYFPRRSDLLAAVADRYAQNTAEVAMKAAAEGAPAGELAASLIGDRKRVRSLVGLLMGSENDKALRARLAESVRNTQRLLAGLLGVPEGDPAATLLQATLWGLGLQHLVNEQQSTKELQALVALARAGSGPVSRKAKRSAA